MSEEAVSKEAVRIAEEILTALYGDDFHGCPVSLNDIAAIVHRGMTREIGATQDLLTTFQKVTEAIALLSTPPDTSQVESPQKLQAVLSERLDHIRTLATKTHETISSLGTEGSQES